MRTSCVSLAACLLLFGLFSIGRAADATAFDAGNAAFEFGDYVQAEREYQTALDSGIHAPHLFYNLAVVQQELGRPLQAAINYRRALFLQPTLIPAWRNLEQLSDSAGIPMPPFGWREEVSQIIEPGTFLIVGSLIFWAGAMFLVLLLFGGRRRFWPGVGSGVLMFLGLGLITVGWLTDPLVAHRAEGMIVADGGAEMRGTPSDNAAAVGRLRAGEAVTIVAERGPWTFVKTANDTEGWIDAEQVEAIIPSGPKET